jgi:hypothetical protein
MLVSDGSCVDRRRGAQDLLELFFPELRENSVLEVETAFSKPSRQGTLTVGNCTFNC